MKVDFLRKRAEKFYENGQNLFQKENYDLAAFSFEQAAQLFLKHYLFVKLKDFPKTHSLTQLLKDIGKSYNQEEEIDQFIKENMGIIADLEEAYITSRYLPAEFYKSQVEEMKKFVKNLISFLENL